LYLRIRSHPRDAHCAFGALGIEVKALAAAFLITGVLFGLAYAGHGRILSVGAVAYCATIEILQLYVPGRHARWIDFAVDALAAVFGIFVRAFGGRTLQKRRP
jgi:VanZ family protein